MSLLRRWKGKERALERRDEGPGAEDGIVLSLELVGSGLYDVAYTLPVKFGAKGQQFSLQVDTGSSDLWVASTSCSSSSCSQTSGHLYNPSGSVSTGVDFSIPYLQGSASGPVVWDKVAIGGYVIDSQAFAAANNVQDEPLAPDFSGILGLALPLNSIIASSIPPVTTNDPDGAAWASNLFSITPVNQAPASRFLSLTLSRPGSDKIPSLLGIGRHPAALVPNPGQVLYSTLVTDKAGILFWKVNVRGITVYVDGVPHHLPLGRSASGGVFPTAVLDSGVPLILTTPSIANAIYGAIGVNPASDGKFYVPCKTPLNMSITIDNRPELALHPLDLTGDPPDDNKADFCIGLIQSTTELSRPDSSIGDMVLGVPFLRNVYTVMAYSVPNSDGSFPHDQTSNSSSHINPRLGLMSLTNATEALNEFNTVRVLNKPISSTGSPNSTAPDDNNTVNIGGTKLSMGIMVLLGLIGFVLVVGILSLLWWLCMRRQHLNQTRSDYEEKLEPGALDKETAYRLVRRGTLTAGAASLSEDEMRELRYRAYKRKEQALTGSTMSSDQTRVESLSYGKMYEKDEGGEGEGEFGVRSKPEEDAEEIWDPLTGLDWGDDTLVGSKRKGRDGFDPSVPLVLDRDTDSPPPSLSPPFPHRRDDSDPQFVPPLQHHHHQRSVDVPLLAALHDSRIPQHEDEVGVTNDTAMHTESPTQPPLLPGPPPLPSDNFYHSKADELGVVQEGSSMAGIGTASQRRKLTMESSFTGGNDGKVVRVGTSEGPWSPSRQPW